MDLLRTLALAALTSALAFGCGDDGSTMDAGGSDATSVDSNTADDGALGTDSSSSDAGEGDSGSGDADVDADSDGSADGGEGDGGEGDGGEGDGGEGDSGEGDSGSGDGGDDGGSSDSGDLGPDLCPDDPNKRHPGACGCGESDHDTDLDGLADCEDPSPNEAFAQPLGPARSAAPRELKGKGFAAAGWDGRLFIGLRNQRIDGALRTTYVAELLRPEVMAGPGRPEFTDASWAPRREFANEITRHGFHVSICADQRYPINPYPSDADGASDPQGTHMTYRIRFIGMDTEPLDSFLLGGFGHVVVAEPGTPTANIVKATMDPAAGGQTMARLMTSSGDRLWHYEPSVTPDCRFVVWHGRVNNDPNASAGVAMYSVNSSPGANGGWETPQSISDAYYVHGPGAASELDVDGVPFSERFPFAREAMRNYDGSVMPRGTYIWGPYPWVSFDGTEIVFPSHITFEGPARSAVTAVGARTGFALRHLDGAVNPMRSDLIPDGRAVIFPTLDPDGVLTKNAYNLAENWRGEPLGNNGYQRLFMIPLALSQSMWSATPLLGDPPLPERRRQGIYAFLLSHSGRYAEVDMHQAEDGHYVLYLPMNEQIQHDVPLSNRIRAGEFTPAQRWEQQRIAIAYSRNRTPDFSGQHHTVVLTSGAQFPYDHDDARGRFDAAFARYRANPIPANEPGAEAVSGDRTQGIVGNAIYFKAGSSVRTTLSTEANARLRSDRGETFSLWVKPLMGGSSYDLLHIAGVKLSLDAGRVVATAPSLRLEGDPAPTGEFTHVALVISPDGTKLYQDGVLVSQVSERAMLRPAAGVIVGPDNIADSDTTVCLIDEVAISDVARRFDEIADAALRRELAPEAPADGAGWPADRPAGLESLQLALPVGSAVPTTEQVALGQRLFEDNILSRFGEHSCATCHSEELAFTDGRELAEAAGTTTRNSPTVLNRLATRLQFFDGRGVSLEAQALQPIADAAELGFSVPELVDRLRADVSYAALFDAAFELEGAPLREVHIAQAIAAYERTLLAGGSRFDTGHLTPTERRGQGLFFGRARCASCHIGPTLSDERFHNVGLDITRPLDHGVASISGRDGDLGRFKTPTLRDISRTAPYLHDGRLETLEDVVDFYNDGGEEVQGQRDLALQPLGLSDSEKADLVAFLRTLDSADGAGVPSALRGPRLGGAGVTSGIWIVGLDFGESPVVVFKAGGAELARVSEGLNYDSGLTPPNWSGEWDRITMTIPPEVDTALGAGPVEVSVVNALAEGPPLELRR